MVIVGLSGTIDSTEILEPVVDVEQMLDERFIARKRDEVIDEHGNSPELSSQIRASGSAVIAVAKISTYLSPDDISNIRIGHASITSQILKLLGD